MSRRHSSIPPAPSWRTIGQMEQARLKRTAQRHRDVLPPHLARLADLPAIGSHMAAELMRHCAQHQLPIARAGRH